jgi:uncharacterized protein (DUF305 family)
MKRLAAILTIGVALTACGGDESSTETSTTSPPEAAAAPAVDAVAANDVDVLFAQGGLSHHAQAVELAEIALDPKAAARPEILELGKAIMAPSPEFEAVEGLLTAWGKPLELAKEEMAKMDGMATPSTIEELATLTGAEFDTAFLTTLVRHHEGAIKMAEKVIAEGTNPDLKPIATTILGMRTSELESIKALLG